MFYKNVLKLSNIFILFYYFPITYGFGFKMADPISDKPQNQYYSFRNNQGIET